MTVPRPPRPKPSTLKKIRVAATILIFLPLTFALIDFTGLGPPAFRRLAAVQFAPALLAGNLVLAGAVVLITKVFGRVYCSAVCPWGVFQDLAARLGRPAYHYQRPQGIWPWLLPIVFIAAALLDFTALAGLLEPYSLFGRLATHLIRPLVIGANNLLAGAAEHFGSYALYKEPFFINGKAALAAAAAGFLLVGAWAWKRGRGYCGVCPVGAMLGVVSRGSVFKIRFDRSACLGCGRCEKVCKASCLDSQARTVDHHRCLACFNCLESCPQGSLSYAPPPRWRRRLGGAEPDGSRRAFLRALPGLAALPVTAAAASSAADGAVMAIGGQAALTPISPPGTLAAAHLQGRCTACHLCVGACPSRVLRPAFLEYGLKGFLQPVMDYTHGFCGYDCTLCSEVCPTGAFHPLSVADKHRTQIGRVVLEKDLCIVHTEGTHCGACAEHCPTQAVTMKPYQNGLNSPEISPEICVGCGGCEFICPVRPRRAIYVNGLPIHARRAEIAEKEAQENQVDSFGF